MKLHLLCFLVILSITDVQTLTSSISLPTDGQIKEPLNKVISFFRSMGISFNQPLRIPTLLDNEGAIGQGSFESPSVFSFFLPEFQPNTAVMQSAGLVAPESMILQGSNILTLLDSMFNTIRFGITDTDTKDCRDVSRELSLLFLVHLSCT